MKRAAATGLGTITFTGNKQINNLKALRATFPIKDGDWFSATEIGKGLDNLKKAYGSLGYINFGAIPKITYDDQKKTVSLNIDIDEGKQFFVSRIEFRATPSLATKSSAANCCSTRVRSTTPSCGSTACCASTSSNTSSR